VGEHFFGLEVGGGRVAQHPLPEAAHSGLAGEALAIRRWIGVLEDAVVGHQRHHGVNIVAVQSIVEAVNSRDRGCGDLVHDSPPF
jgi:hypothetical protein